MRAEVRDELKQPLYTQGEGDTSPSFNISKGRLVESTRIRVFERGEESVEIVWVPLPCLFVGHRIINPFCLRCYFGMFTTTRQGG